MKKIVLLTALLSLSLASCGDDDKPQEVVTKDPLVGKWNLIKAEYYENGTLVMNEDLKPGTCNYDYYDLKTGGSKDEIYHNPDDNCATENFAGTWSYNASNKQVTMIDTEDGYTVITEVISINDTDLKVKLISADGETLPEGIESYLYLKK